MSKGELSNRRRGMAEARMLPPMRMRRALRARGTGPVRGPQLYSTSRGMHALEKLLHRAHKLIALARQRLRRSQHLRRRRAGVAGATIHVGDGARNLGSTLRRPLNVA